MCDRNIETCADGSDDYVVVAFQPHKKNTLITTRPTCQRRSSCHIGCVGSSVCFQIISTDHFRIRHGSPVNIIHLANINSKNRLSFSIGPLSWRAQTNAKAIHVAVSNAAGWYTRFDVPARAATCLTCVACLVLWKLLRKLHVCQ